MAKLWQKGFSINALLESFTVGLDYQLDGQLVKADCMGSIAHSRGLSKAGLLSREEQASLEALLREIAGMADTSQGFPIRREDEDCHTAIEAYLTEKLGQTGKKIHLGRSRNDQVLTMLRLFGKERLIDLRSALLSAASAILHIAQEHEFTPMPGRTHMQVAMPSTIGLWAGAFVQQLLDDYSLLQTAWHLNDQSPLGAAASYGVPLPLDREFTAKTMGFSRVQRNVLAANNGRGKVESIILDALDQVCISLSKIAQDLILFSLPEFGYFSLPDELTSGSSIMPQKKNPDGLELLRARAGSVSGWATQVKNVIRSLPSGYNRDFQDTKEPFLRGTSTALECLQITRLTMEKLTVHPEALKSGFSPDIYATDDAISLVEQGLSFRDAYRQVGMNIEQVQNRNPDDLLHRRQSTGYAGNLGLSSYRETIQGYSDELRAHETVHRGAVRDCLGVEMKLA